MQDETTDESNDKGKETDKPVEDISELDKLKANNDELEKELVKGRELKAEAQKLEAEKMVGGKADAGQEKVEEKISDSDYADKLMKGEANPLEEDGISLNS